MINLKTVVLMLLEHEEVIINDAQNNSYVVILEKVADGVDCRGATTLVIRVGRLKD